MDDVEKLIGGGKCVDVLLSKDKTYLMFTFTDKAPLYYQAEGDCCSSSWFEHFSGIDALLGHEITAAEVVEMDELPEYTGEIKIYSIKLRTEAGHIDIEMRNESNGYYGGTFGLVEGMTFRSPELQGVAFTSITKDF